MFSYGVLQKIHKAIALIYSGSIDELEIGLHELEDGISVRIMEYETKSSGLFESHHRHVDIHYIINGNEYIRIEDEEKLAIVSEYNNDEDYLLGNADGFTYLIPEKKPFVVMPGEAHLPGIMIGKAEKVKKAVIKILI